MILSPAWARQHPVQTLLLCFAAWKSLLLFIALFSPGRGYDTSTSLVLAPQPGHHHGLSGHPETTDRDHIGPLPLSLYHVANKLTRWDAIYFTQVATRGYRFEQEWAFGWGFTRLIAFVTSCK